MGVSAGGDLGVHPGAPPGHIVSGAMHTTQNTECAGPLPVCEKGSARAASSHGLVGPAGRVCRPSCQLSLCSSVWSALELLLPLVTESPTAASTASAIRASLHPADGTAFYFVATGLGDGSHQFSDTKEQHDKAVREYLARQRATRNISE